ncbi:MAG: glycogen debranching protein GlgX, partial [Gammaproteobacteria bacterium]
MAAYPLGAHCIDGGVNFALVAPHAERVELCLFDAAGSHETARIALADCDAGVWHGFVPGLAAGQVYGYRVHGADDPARGLRFNPALVVLDPYARDIVGQYRGQDGALKARVTEDAHDWGEDRPPRVAPADTVLYETHVKGFTRLLDGVPDELRGTYAGLASEAALAHLERLGATSVSLLPVHHRADEPRLLQHGLSNYWGYSTIGYFAPEPRYWSGRAGTTPASELRDAIKALHARGIEVILDVVYNHTAELDELGPTLSMRAIDNPLYYYLRPDDAALYENWTGCGNTLNLSEPRVLQLVMDSLRHWVQAYHVDGFRFDLAPVLGRDARRFSNRAAFFAAVRQDPVLAQVKLIAEPWDIGPDGYQLGRFPAGWLEWNDRFRDTMRAFWLRGDVSLGAFAQRFAGSSDLFEVPGRTVAASVNFICAHDGFTLADLVSYDHKHNEANGENNRDGHAHNLSWNCGVEGPTCDADVLALRARLQRALLATLVFAHGTPMLLGGDEIGHSQGGNNNAYCQDNATTWLDWPGADHALAAFVARLLALRKRYP